MSRSSAKKKPALSLTPEQEAFLNDPGPAPARVPAEVRESVLREPKTIKVAPTGPTPPVEEPRLGPLPRSHRLQSSGRVVRRVTGFVSFELGKRFETYLETEERTASYVLERALKAWLDARQT